MHSLFFANPQRSVKGVVSGDLNGHGVGYFSHFIDWGKFYLKSHEPPHPSLEGHHLAETQPTAGTLLIEEQRNVSAYPDECLL